jgi:N utilization substance protein B
VNSEKRIKRSTEREYALQAVYAYELSGDTWEKQLLLLEENTNITGTRFVRKHLELYSQYRDLIDREIIQKLRNWDFTRLAVIDKIILRMAVIELLYFKDIPPEVSLNEAIELAKKFSTEKSDKFINGILDAIVAELKNEGRIKKSGRGLVSNITGG